MRYREGMRLGWIGVALGLAGCGADGGAGGVDYMDDDFPAGGCRDTEAPGTDTECDTDDMPATDSAFTGGTSNACEGSADCMGGHCVAPWDAATEMRGAFVCEFACVDAIDERRWCSDDGSCCDPAARCTARGYCIVDGDGTSTTSEDTTTSSPATSSTDDTGTGSATDDSGTSASTDNQTSGSTTA